MSKRKYHLIFTGSSVEILSLVDALEKKGIQPIIKDQGESARLAGFGVTSPLQQQVFLHEEELDEGKKVLALLF